MKSRLFFWHVFVAWMMFLVKSFSQSTPNTNLGLQYIDQSTGNTLNYMISNINSDFGPRICPDCSIWHKGIDLNRTGEVDYGDRIISPVYGTIKSIQIVNTYIVLVVQGDNGENYGYGHIFSNFTGATQLLGGFALKYMEGANCDKLAIIDFINGRAFSSVSGGTVELVQTYTTTNRIEAGWPIAPVGNSAAYNGTHLHLYLFKDAGLTAPLTQNNCKNPFQTLAHYEDTKYDITIEELTNLTEYGQTSFYRGDIRASVKVRIAMPGGGNSSTYTEQIMLIDSALLEIKKFGEPDIKYNTILGQDHESEIILGGRRDRRRKPSLGYPSTNASYDIANQYANNSRVGVFPHAYAENNARPWDDWFFSDIFTRIKNTDEQGGVLNLANSNAEARYPDGVYLIRPKAYRIDNNEAINPTNTNNNAPRQIIIDNFQPFVSYVRIRESGSPFYKYERGWHWINNKYLLTPLPVSQIASQNDDVIVQITTSEPMRKVTLNVGTHPELMQLCGEDLNKTQWSFTLSHNFLSPGIQQLFISGEDLATNPILANPSLVPIRLSGNNWSPPLPGIIMPDNWHSFIFGNTDVDFNAQQTGMLYNQIKFTDKSNISGLYKWEFGDPAQSHAFTKDACFEYNNLGTYLVTHSVNQISISKPVSVNEILHPTSKFVFSPWFQNLKNSLINIDVDFYSTSEGIISSYAWDFGNGIVSSEKNPKGIPFSLYTWYKVKLTVTNIAGSDTYELDLFLDPNAIPYVTLFGWQIDYFVFDFDVVASNFKQDKPVIYTIDYGDGTSEQTDGLLSSFHTFNHQYYNMGRFLVVTTVEGTDQYGNIKTVSTAKEIGVSPYALDVELYHSQLNNPPPYPLQAVTFNVMVSPSCNFFGNYAIYKIGDPTFYKSWNFTSSNSERVYQFPQAGAYRVIADVTNMQLGVTGHDEVIIQIVNAPDYMDVKLFGQNSLSHNTDFTFEAQLSPTGNPGVHESMWWATNLKWTLIRPDNVQEITSESFNYWEAAYAKWKTFHFGMEGQYTLRVEAWNDQYDYENNNLINPDFANTICYYDYDEIVITVAASIPALKLLSPGFPDPVSSSGTEDIVLKFTNPSTTPIRWEVELGSGIICNNCINLPQPSAGQNLAWNTEVVMVIDVNPNPDESRRFSQVRINGYTAGNQHVQGSPAHILIDQYGKAGPSAYVLEGNNPDQCFGSSVSVDGSVILVGAPSLTNTTGSAYIYEKNQFGDWELRAHLSPTGMDKHFGEAVEISGDNIVIAGSNSEYIYFFRRPYSGWAGNLQPTKKILADFANRQHIRVAIWGDYAAISSAYQSNNSGIVKVYYRNQGGTDNWGLVKTISDCSQSDFFGYSVDIYNDVLVVGAPQQGFYRGFIKVYKRNHNGMGAWGLMQTILPPVTSEKPDMRFGQSVSVFQNSITTSYYHSYLSSQGYAGYLRFPLYHSLNPGLYAFVDEGSWWIHQAEETFSNYIYASSLYKDMFNGSIVNANCPAEYDVKTIWGAPMYNNHSGRTGHSIPVNNSYWSVFFAWPVDYFFSQHYPNEYFGNSLSQSYSYEVRGIPGYNRTTGKRGAIYILKNSANNIKSNFDAEIDFDFVDFVKPAGSYSTINGRNLTIGGDGHTAQISAGAQILFEGGNIQLRNGFVACQGSNFVAKSIRETTTGKSKTGKCESEYDNKLLIIKRFINAFPDFPWHTFDLINDIEIISEDIVHKTPYSSHLLYKSQLGIFLNQKNKVEKFNCLRMHGFGRLLSLHAASSNN